MKKYRNIVVEGLPGCGKTSITKHISKSFGLFYFPEHVFPDQLLGSMREKLEDSEEIYLYHWETKSKLQKMLNCGFVSDRNHLTTLAYNYAKSKFKKDARYFNNVFLWYKKVIKNGLLIEPDCYILLNIPPNFCNIRKNRVEGKLLWSKVKMLNCSLEFYSNFEEIIFSNLVRKPLVFRVDATEKLRLVKRRVTNLLEGHV